MPTLSKHYGYITLPNGAVVEPISIDVTVDETWAPYVQANVVVPTNLITANIDPRQDSRIKVHLQQDFGDLIYIHEITADFGGDVSNITAGIVPMKVSTFTRRYASPWNIFETGLPLSTVTTAYAPVTPAKLTAAGFNTVWRMSDFLHAEGTFNPAPSTIFDADLGVRSIDYDYVSKEATIQLASDEALAQDVLGYGDDITIYYSNLRDLINEALGVINATLQPGTANKTYSPQYELLDYNKNLSNSVWDFIETVATAAGFKIYCDELRRWYLIDPNAVTGNLALKDDDNITTFTKTLSRETNWYNYAVIQYDDPSLGQTIYDSYYAPGTGAVRSLYQKKENIGFPGMGAAQSIVERTVTRGEIYSVEAIANFDSRPRQTLTVDITDETIKSGVTQSITWSLPSARMSLDIRDLQEV